MEKASEPCPNRVRVQKSCQIMGLFLRIGIDEIQLVIGDESTIGGY
jgi:hypothetical protein